MKIATPLITVALLALLSWCGVAYLHLYTLFGVIIPYTAFALFVVGFVIRIIRWGKSAVPFRIATTCGQQKSLPGSSRLKPTTRHRLPAWWAGCFWRCCASDPCSATARPKRTANRLPSVRLNGSGWARSCSIGRCSSSCCVISACSSIRFPRGSPPSKARMRHSRLAFPFCI